MRLVFAATSSRTCGNSVFYIEGSAAEVSAAVQKKNPPEDEPAVRPLWKDRLPDGESQLPGQGAHSPFKKSAHK